MRMGHIVAIAVVGFSLAAPVWAQQQTGVLQGKVTDASGAVLPGLTVTVSGPTILGGSLVAVTGAGGTYRVPNIPVGSYQVTFELEGFEKKVYEDVRVQVAATFTIDVQLGIGGVEESVTVVGESPIIETAATNVGFTFTKDLLTTIPNARDLSMLNQIPGVTTTYNVGGTTTGSQAVPQGHGTDSRQATYVLDGANVTDNQGVGTSQFFFDVDTIAEMQVQTASHNAEIQTPGVMMNILPKSGTNVLRGTASLYYDNEQMQSDNVGDLRERGVDRASNLQLYFDTGFDVGGPIRRDKVWFWGAFRWQDVRRFITGTKNADGTFPVERTYLWYPSARVNWQITRGHNFSSYFNMAQKKVFNRNLSALRPVETAQTQQGAPVARLFTFRDDWVVSSKILVNLKLSIMNQGYEVLAQDDVDVANTPARYDAATGMWADAPPSEIGQGKSLRSAAATLSYYTDDWLGGQHNFKFGYEEAHYRVFGNQRGGVAITTYPADHRLTLFNGAPLEVTLYAPDAQSVYNPTRSAFAQDSWKRGRFTLNLGARWDWTANSLPAVTAPKSRYLEAVRQEKTGNLVTWSTVAPRLGVIYDVTGHAKTLLKGSVGRYYWQLFTDKGARATAAGERSYRYSWNDLNGDRNFQYPDELGTLLRVTDPATNPVTIDPGLRPTLTDEITAGFVRELMPNWSVSGTLMYRKDKDLDWRINRDISPSDYTPVTGIDPGPDGQRGTSDDGGALVFYEIAAAKRALSANFVTTRPGFEQEYRGFEVVLQRRMASRWQLVTSFTLGKNQHNYGPGSYQNPQDVDKMDGIIQPSSVPWVAKVMGSYQLPNTLVFSGSYQARSGDYFTRTVNSSSAVGRSLNQGNVAILSGMQSEQSYDPLHYLDARVGYDLRLANRTISLALDGFNLLNVNTVTRIQVLSGSAYDRVLSFVAPRIVRLSVNVRF